MENDPSLFDALIGAQFLLLTTYRKSGQAVATQVWFAIASLPDTIYIKTGAQTGKVKRIRKTAHVMLAPCTGLGKITGEVFEAQARLVSTEDERQRAERALARKYGLRRKLVSGFLAAGRKLLHQPPLQTVYLAVERRREDSEQNVGTC